MSSRRQATADRPADADLAAGATQPGGAAGPDTEAQTHAADAEAAEVPERTAAAGPPAETKRLPMRVPADGRSRAEARPAVQGQAGSDPEPPADPGLRGGNSSPEKEPISRSAEPAAVESVPGLPARLIALARMIEIASARTGRDAFGNKLLTEAAEVLARAGERMRLSSTHTVVVLAGGTGSGKSSLFNQIAGVEFSEVGVTRPVTTEPHACIWGDAGSGAILDWLDIPSRFRYARASELDRGEEELAGLVLVDLPDHDSVMNHSGDVARLVGMADVMIWVLDPQKYADAAVHKRFLMPMAGHSAVLAVVLNQSDLLDPSLAHDCVADLRRLLDSEDLPDVPILVTSAVTGAGIDDLISVLADGVAARRAAAIRISADADQIVSRFQPFAGEVDAPVGSVPLTSKLRLTDRFASAAGISAVADALRSARELRAADFIGWPVAWFVQRIAGRNPLRKVRLGMLWNDLRSITAGPAGAQQSEIDNALTDLGNDLAEPLPQPWSRTVRAAVRSRADQIPPALGAAIGQVLPDEDNIIWWWRLTGLWQGLLLGAATVAIAWMGLILAFGVFHAAAGAPALLSRTSALPWIAAVAGAALVLGAVTASVCTRLVVSAAERENSHVIAAMKDRIASVAAEMVIDPAEQELAELGRFRDETRIAAGGIRPAQPVIVP